MLANEPARDCALCPRLAEFRRKNAEAWPDWHNAPVPSFGPRDSNLLIVGLAPGLRGANRTGRPFTGDYAGDLLYPTIAKFGFGAGQFDARPDDGFKMTHCRITNAVRCVPPENKPTTDEIIACNQFLKAEIEGQRNLRAILALGLVAHKAILRSMGLVAARYTFGHGAMHELPNGLLLANSYHCSRYNTNTGRLTEEMFHAVFSEIRDRLAVKD
ncbi:MAG: uracil-DNA glycosylase, partial [Alphaproteobacteria bacterium]|nr:uracil-DNA glycosylase [Alphaproteobacteria bacterium]